MLKQTTRNTKMLAVNEYHRIPWGQNLHRIGVMSDGSCFFHSLLTSIDPSYCALPVKDKTSKVVAFRKQVASALTIKDFHTLSSHYTPLYKDLPARVQHYHKEHYFVDEKETVRLASELESYAYELKQPTTEEVKKFLQNFLAFREYISNPTEAVGDELHLLVSRVLGVDIYLTTTQEDGSMGYILHDPSRSYQGRSSIVVHKVPNKDHWEAVGQFKETGLMTLFEPTSTVITQLRKCFEDHWTRLQG